MRIVSLLSLVLASWLVLDHVMPRHCFGTFRVRNWTTDVLGFSFGLEQYGIHRFDERGLTPLPMTTVILIGPVGTVSVDQIAQFSFSILSATALYGLGTRIFSRSRKQHVTPTA